MFKNYDEMLAEAKSYSPMTVAVAGAEEESVLKALKRAEEEGLVKPLFFGGKEVILKLADNLSYKIEPSFVIDAGSPEICASLAVQAVSSGKADIVMKGGIRTDILMKAVLNKEYGLRNRQVVSHVFFIKLPDYEKFLALTDGGINIAPDLPTQVEIIKNAVDFYNLVGLDLPKIAVLAPVETVNEKIPSTLYGAALSKMADRGQIKGCLIDGPLAFDNAISAYSAKEKNIHSKVAGSADLIFVSDIDMGNGLFKGLVYFGKGVPAAVVLGTKNPVIITSRADSSECKFFSIALNVLYAGRLRDRKLSE